MVHAASQEEQLTVFVGSGDVRPQEWLEALQTAVTPRVLCDLSRARLHGMTSSELRDLALRLAGTTEGGRRAAKAAIVCAGEADYGMARMLATFASVAGCLTVVAVFHGEAEARAWLLTA